MDGLWNAAVPTSTMMPDKNLSIGRTRAESISRSKAPVMIRAQSRDEFSSGIVERAHTSCGNVLQDVEFSFLDNKNVCCGLCGEIVPYNKLTSRHLPQAHPNVMTAARRKWLEDKLEGEKRSMEKGYKLTVNKSALRVPKKCMTSRLVSQKRRPVSKIRVNPREMTLQQLDEALRQKMAEKLNRQVPVTLIDKLHAKCGLCNTVISINKKFEIAHLVRHFNCWHPTAHDCAGKWLKKAADWEASKGAVGNDDRASTSTLCRQSVGGKPLSGRDFAVVEIAASRLQTLQCIWCGLFVDSTLLAQHFDEKHAGDVQVPKCHLCMQEVEKYSLDMLVTFSDMYHIVCGPCSKSFTSETAFWRHIMNSHANESPESARRHKAVVRNRQTQDKKQITNWSEDEAEVEEEDSTSLNEETEERAKDPKLEAIWNSCMVFGRRVRPKRLFVLPSLRQAGPMNSKYIEPLAESHWRCKLCNQNIYGAVISAAAIKHYKSSHESELDSMQFEVCQARLEKMSDGCMELVEAQLVECLLCEISLPLHQPFNVCRAVRHLKAKHCKLMPEYIGSRHESHLSRQRPSKAKNMAVIGADFGRNVRPDQSSSAAVVVPSRIVQNRPLTRSTNLALGGIQTNCATVANLSAIGADSSTLEIRSGATVQDRQNGIAIVCPPSADAANRSSSRPGTIVILQTAAMQTAQRQSSSVTVLETSRLPSTSIPLTATRIAEPSAPLEPCRMPEPPTYRNSSQGTMLTLEDGMTVLVEEIMDDVEEEEEDELDATRVQPTRHQHHDSTEQFIMHPMDNLDSYGEVTSWAYGRDYGNYTSSVNQRNV